MLQQVLIKYEIVVCTHSCICMYVCLFADSKGQSSETHWRYYLSWVTSSCRWWSQCQCKWEHKGVLK